VLGRGGKDAENGSRSSRRGGGVTLVQIFQLLHNLKVASVHSEMVGPQQG